MEDSASGSAIGVAVPPPRARRPEDGDRARPFYAVWELTLHCDQPCEHCGSRAGKPRAQELSTAELLAVADALADLGCREVALIGGEAYLRKDVYQVVSHLVGHGMRVSMQTGGRGFNRDKARAFKAAGLAGVGVSIDGPEAIHDTLRGNAGSHAAALAAIDHAREAGLVVMSNMQVNRLNYLHLRETADEIRRHGVVAWQVALTVPMGNAADRPDWIVEPWMVVDIIDTLAEIQLEAVKSHTGGEAFNIATGNNLGYFGPHEEVLRSRPGGKSAHWSGCHAGINAIGIESDGTVKPCPSLPTAPYIGGNVRELSLERIWEQGEAMRFARDRTLEELWGFCKTCYFAENCRGGCSWMAHCTLGRRGNNPFCYHRVKQLERAGVRERLVLKERAPHEPYDFGRFEIIEDALNARGEEPAAPPPRRALPIVR